MHKIVTNIELQRAATQATNYLQTKTGLFASNEASAYKMPGINEFIFKRGAVCIIIYMYGAVFYVFRNSIP